MVPVNIWAVLVNAIIAMVIGFLWYGPVFGKQWIASMGWSEAHVQEGMKKSMTLSYLWMFAGALVMSFVLAHAVIFAQAYLDLAGAGAGALFGIASWAGFVAPSSLSGVLFEGKPWKWWLLFNGYYLVTLAIMGVVFAVWM